MKEVLKSRRGRAGITAVLCLMFLCLAALFAVSPSNAEQEHRNDVKVIGFGIIGVNPYIQFDLGTAAPYDAEYLHINTSGETAITDHILVNGQPFVSDWSAPTDVMQSFDNLSFYTPFEDGTTIEVTAGLAFASGTWSNGTPLSGDTLGESFKMKKIGGEWFDLTSGEENPVRPTAEDFTAYASDNGTDASIDLYFNDEIASEQTALDTASLAKISVNGAAATSASANGTCLTVRFPKTEAATVDLSLGRGLTFPAGRRVYENVEKSMRFAKEMAVSAIDPAKWGNDNFCAVIGEAEAEYKDNQNDVLSLPSYSGNVLLNGGPLKDSYNGKAYQWSNIVWFDTAFATGDKLMLKSGLGLVNAGTSGAVYATGDTLDSDYLFTKTAEKAWDFEKLATESEFVGYAVPNGENYEVSVVLNRSVSEGRTNIASAEELGKIAVSGNSEGISAYAEGNVLTVVFAKNKTGNAAFDLTINKGFLFPDGTGLSKAISVQSRPATRMPAKDMIKLWGTQYAIPVAVNADGTALPGYDGNCNDILSLKACSDHLFLNGEPMKTAFSEKVYIASGNIWFGGALTLFETGDVIRLEKEFALVAPGANGTIFATGDTLDRDYLFELQADGNWTQIVAVESIETEETEITLKGVTDFQIEYAVQPANATNQSVSFLSSDEGVLTVSATGAVSVKGPGSATVTLTSAYDRTITAEISFTVVTVTGIELTAPAKLTYFEGQNLDLTGAALRLTYSDESAGEDVLLEAGMISGYDKTTAGKQTVTVSYQTFVETFEVTVLANVVEEIEITELPGKVHYFVGQDLDPTGGKLSATYSNGDVEREIEITSGMISGFDKTKAGKQTITVTYGGKTAEFEVTVVAVAPAAISANLEKTVYQKGEDLDLSGVKLRITNNDGSVDSVELTADMISGFDKNKTGEQTLTVTYGGLTTTLTVTVNGEEKTGCGSFAFGGPTIFGLLAAVCVLGFFVRKREKQ